MGFLIILIIALSSQIQSVGMAMTSSNECDYQPNYYFRISPKHDWLIQLLDELNAIYTIYNSEILTNLTKTQAASIYLEVSKNKQITFEQIDQTQYENPGSYPFGSSLIITNQLILDKAERGQQITAIIIDDDYYNDLSSYLLRYIEDVMNYFYQVSFQIYHPKYSDFNSPEEVRSFFQQLHYDEGVNGAIIIGKLKYANFELPWEEVATLALFYEDLDGIFLDKENDGIYDYRDWGPNKGIEMWTSWIIPPSEDSINYLRSYFDKTHQYYTNEDMLFRNALLTVNEDWCGVQDGALGDAFNSTYGGKWDFLGCDSTPDAYVSEFIELWRNNNYQALNIWAHSSFHGHYFDWDNSQPPGNYLSAFELGSLQNGPQFSIVFGCGCMNLSYDPENSLSTWYIMGENNGMSAIGTTRSIGLPEQEYLIENISTTQNLGELIFNYLNIYTSEEYISSRYPDEVHTFVWDVIFVGNPYLFRHPNYQFINYFPLIER